MVKVKDLKHKPQEMEMCKYDCEHYWKWVKYCVLVEKCEDIYLMNWLWAYSKDNLTPNTNQDE